jgi:hypothetical protein
MTKQALTKYDQESKEKAPDLKHADRIIRLIFKQSKVATFLTYTFKYEPIAH